MPLFPLFLVSLAAALFDIGLTTVALTTAVGMTPLAMIDTGVGREIGTVSSLGDLLSPQALLTLSALAGLSLLPILFKPRMPAGAAAAAPKPEARP